MTRMNKEEFLRSGMLEQYVMGLLSESENESVEYFISNFSDVKEVYNELQETIESMAQEYKITSPDSAKQRVMDMIKNSEGGATADVPQTNGNYILPIAAGIIALLSCIGYWKYTTLSAELDKQEEAYAMLKQDCNEGKEAMASLEDALYFYTHSETRVKGMTGNTIAPSLYARTYYNKVSEKMIVKIEEPPTLKSGKIMCIWGDLNGEMKLIAKLEGDERFYNFDKAMDSFNITLEDENAELHHPDVSQLVSSVNI